MVMGSCRLLPSLPELPHTAAMRALLSLCDHPEATWACRSTSHQSGQKFGIRNGLRHKLEGSLLSGKVLSLTQAPWLGPSVPARSADVQVQGTTRAPAVWQQMAQPVHQPLYVFRQTPMFCNHIFSTICPTLDPLSFQAVR